jgi:hypothetical protein
MLAQFNGLLLLLALLVPLLLLQRTLHGEIQAVFLLISRDPVITIWLFSLMFFPGILLHETSHFLTAKVLGVRTGKFSLLPRALPGGRLQLGSVEVAQTDVVRDSIIGVAPLIAGGLFIAYAAIYHMHLLTVWEFLRAGETRLFSQGLVLLPRYSDFWLWFYLVFVVSSTMMPSESDRHAWRPLGIYAALLLGLALLAGAGQWMLDSLAPALNSFFKSVSLIFALSVVLHLLLLAPTMLAHRILSSATGLDVR